MELKKYLNAFKNASQIVEGIKNNMFKKEHIEAEAALRWAICKACPVLDMKGDKCLAPGTQPCCGDCGCSLAFKTRSLSSSCPLGHWNALMDEETENNLINSIEDENRTN
ncbi:MAG: hypothetical protein E6R13_03485 [Spirochaetes bacterium]|nr:MAG: hypothetical protein E6R13_03485 [Spirochaetota bacterium]